MNRILSLLVTVILILSIACSASALTIQSLNNDLVVYDQLNELYWFPYLSHFIFKSYDDQVEDIASLNTGVSYAGLTDWHLATYDEMDSLWQSPAQDIRDNFFASYVEIGSKSYWTGRYDHSPWEGDHYYAYITDTERVGLEELAMLDTDNTSKFGAWAVATAQPTVPEPTTMLLLGTGLLGLAGIRRKLKK